MDSVVADRLNAQIATTVSRKNVWLFMNCLHFPWRKGSSRIESLCGLDPALRATLGPCTAREHNQHCPSYNHTTTTIVFAVHTLSELMCLQEDPSGWEMISQTVSTFGLDHCYEKNNFWQIPQSACFIQFGWRQFIQERWVGVSFCLFPFWELFLPVQNRR